MMKYYPINLDINNRKCLVVGGGSVGTRKVKTLIRCGAVVMVVSMEFSHALSSLADDDQVTLIKRSYESSDLEGMFLVIGATSNEGLNRRVSEDAEKRNMLCNIADVPDACNFILPSIVNRGDLLIAISTSGRSPAFAKKLRRELEGQFGEEYSVFLKLMGAVREKLLNEAHEPEAHKPLFERLIDGGLLEKIKVRDVEEIDAVLSDVLGEGYRCETLIGKTF